MLIIAVLAAAIIPAVLSQLDAAARTKEAKDLSALAAALQTSVLRHQQIPDHTGWAAAAADEVANAPNNVSTNQRHFARAYLINPALSLAGTGLPFTQTTNGTARPANATLMIVGSTRGNLPLVSGAPSAAAFTELWTNAPGQKPTTWTTYSGNGDDLQVQRINLEPLFCRLILHNLAANGQPRFQISSNALVTLTTNSPARVSYYLKGTVFGLFDTNANLQAREILSGDTYRVFDGSFWRDELIQGRPSVAAASTSGFASQFLAALPPSPAPKWDATPKGVATMFYTYMFAYSAWASETPCFRYDGNGNNKKCPEHNLMDQALDNFKKGGNLLD